MIKKLVTTKLSFCFFCNKESYTGKLLAEMFLIDIVKMS